MSINEITAKIESLREWESLASEAAAQVESLKDELKQFMQEQGVEEYEAGSHIIRWTTVLSNRFDSTAFKKVMNNTVNLGRLPNTVGNYDVFPVATLDVPEDDETFSEQEQDTAPGMEMGMSP